MFSLNKDISKEKIFPMPEILNGHQGRKWKIAHSDSVPTADEESKLMGVPLDDDGVSHCQRLQTVGRIKYDDPSVEITPEEKESLLLKSIDDFRINYLLKGAGIDISDGFLSESVKNNFFDAIRGYSEEHIELSYRLLTHSTVDEIKKSSRNTSIPKMFNMIAREIKKSPTKKNVVRLARLIIEEQQYEDYDLDSFFPPPDPSSLIASSMATEDGYDPEKIFATAQELVSFAEDEAGNDNKIRELPSDVASLLPNEKMQLSHPKESVRLAPWGKMEIEEPPRIISCIGRSHRKWKPQEEGVIPRYPHRFFIDRQVFARRCKEPGGTVLIDASGSMSMSPQDIQEIVRHAPGCTVACYSADRYDGKLRILAKNGKRVSDEYCISPCGGCNVIDYHAVLWVFKQSAPRIWITDGGVSGIGDIMEHGNKIMCQAVAKKGRFFVIGEMEEAIRTLKKIGKLYKK